MLTKEHADEDDQDTECLDDAVLGEPLEGGAAETGEEDTSGEDEEPSDNHEDLNRTKGRDVSASACTPPAREGHSPCAQRRSCCICSSCGYQ